MGGYDITVSCNCGAKRVPFTGAVPSLEQLSAQHRRAVTVCASLLGMWAALQQSMSPIEWSMLQDCSPDSTGTPANALPVSISTSIRDVSRIRMTVIHSMKRVICCQDDLGQYRLPKSQFFQPSKDPCELCLYRWWLPRPVRSHQSPHIRRSSLPPLWFL